MLSVSGEVLCLYLSISLGLGVILGGTLSVTCLFLGMKSRENINRVGSAMPIARTSSPVTEDKIDVGYKNPYDEGDVNREHDTR